MLNKTEGTLVAIDPATLKIVGKVPTGNGPHEAATSAVDGKLAFVTNYGAQQAGNLLSIVDLVAMKELRRVDLGAFLRPHGIDERGGKLYRHRDQHRHRPAVACADRADPGWAAIKAGELPIRIKYVSLAQANQVAVIDLEKLEVVDKVETGAGPDGLAWSVLKR